jgi:YebC/PmpR family DNA-binding regulatory protein
MSGHNKWAQIKHKKAITDAKRGKNFTKLLSAITIAAKSGDSNPDFNPRLRSAVKAARDAQMPADNIERAIKRASDTSVHVEEALLEAYGVGGVAILIEAVTDNTNRTVPEIKKILNDRGGKWAESGSVLWAFQQDTTTREWSAKFPMELPDEDAESLLGLIEALEEHPDVQNVVTNIAEEEAEQ